MMSGCSDSYFLWTLKRALLSCEIQIVRKWQKVWWFQHLGQAAESMACTDDIAVRIQSWTCLCAFCAWVVLLLPLEQIWCALCSQTKASPDLPVSRHSTCGLPYRQKGSNSRKASWYKTSICLRSPSHVPLARMELFMCIFFLPECSQAESEEPLFKVRVFIFFWEGKHRGSWWAASPC